MILNFKSNILTSLRLHASLWILIAFSLSGTYAFSQDLPEDGTFSGKFENGLSYYIKPNDNPENQIEIRLVVKAGSLYEEDSEQGFAHFVEHMCFNGTKNYPGNEAISYLQSKGLRFGKHFNALTSFAETKYMLSLNDPDEDLLENSFQILEDWAHQVSFDEAEIESERGVILQELRTGLGAETRLREQAYPAIFRGATYQYRLPIGKKDILESFRPEELRAFYNKWYRPERMAVIVAGDIEYEKAKDFLERHFAHIENNHPAGTIPSMEVIDNDKPVFKVCTDKEAGKEQIRIYFLKDCKALNSPSEIRRDISEELIIGMINRRFQKINQSPDSPFIYCNTGIGKLVRTKGSFTYTGLAKTGRITDALNLMLLENRRLYLHGFTPSELDLEKKIFTKQIQTTASEKEDSKSIANNLMEKYLDQETPLGMEIYSGIALNILPQINAEEINKVLKQLIAKQPIIITNMTSPEVSSEFMTEGMQILYNSIQASNPEKYKPESDEKVLHTEIEQEGKVIKEKKIEEYNITKWTLSNGATVILKPTDYKNNEILFSAYSIGGFSQYQEEDYVSASLSVSTAFMSGLQDLNFPELRNKMKTDGVRIAPWLTEYSEGIKGRSDNEGLESLLQLNYLYFTELKADSLTASAYLSRRMSQMEAMKKDPEYFFSDTINRILYGNNPGTFILSDSEDFKHFNLARANEIARERFSDPSGFTFAFTGSFDIENVRPLIEKYIGGLKKNPKNESIPDHKYFSIKKGKEIVVYSGEAGKSYVDIVFFGKLPQDIESRVTATAMAEVLKVKLRESLREEKGGIYGINVSSSTDIIPENYFKLEIFFECATAMVDDLVEESFNQLEKIKKEGPDPETLETVKSVLKSEYLKKTGENKYWQENLPEIFGLEKDMDTELSGYLPALINVSSKDIQLLARKKLRKNKMLISKMFPEKK